MIIYKMSWNWLIYVIWNQIWILDCNKKIAKTHKREMTTRKSLKCEQIQHIDVLYFY